MFTAPCFFFFFFSPLCAQYSSSQSLELGSPLLGRPLPSQLELQTFCYIYAHSLHSRWMPLLVWILCANVLPLPDQKRYPLTLEYQILLVCYILQKKNTFYFCIKKHMNKICIFSEYIFSLMDWTYIVSAGSVLRGPPST